MGKYFLEFEISIAPTDSNRILGVNKFAKATIFRKVKNEVINLVRGKAPSAPLTSFKISAKRFSPQFMDLDNCYSMLKPYIDGLKYSGVILDDKWIYLNCDNYKIEQEKSKQKRIILTIEEL
jgi:Holliday junction resolvase RusA-like endonuclease